MPNVVDPTKRESSLLDTIIKPATKPEEAPNSDFNEPAELENDEAEIAIAFSGRNNVEKNTIGTAQF